jgi:hypothetical protein
MRKPEKGTAPSERPCIPQDTLVDQLLAEANANSDQHLELTKAAKKLKKREDRSMSNVSNRTQVRPPFRGQE